MDSLLLRRYRAYEWRIASMLFCTYMLVAIISAWFIPESLQLYPASVIALCALFFGGLRLWPIVYFAALLSGMLTDEYGVYLFISSAAVTLQALAGASLLHERRLDPIFRRSRDILYLFATVITIAFITPTFMAFTSVAVGFTYTPTDWGRGYMASVFTFLVGTPFILRWSTKPRLNPRTPRETIETAAVFLFLIAINFALYVLGIEEIAHIPTIYLLLAPLFLISLRLRPRFTTLALLITSLFAISATIAHAPVHALAAQLFTVEAFLVALSTVFFIVTTLEEERRVHTNLMLSQLATLENAVTRVSLESRAKNDFIAMLAHELRNPLAPIVSMIDLLKLKSGRDQEDMEALAIMSDRMSAIRRLLDDLLDISRISEGKVTLIRELVDLERIMQRAFLSSEHLRTEMRQQLIFKTPGQQLYVSGDPIRIEQIFTNVLTNASKYSDHGDTITVHMRGQEGRAYIEVVDQGIGLEPHEIKKIFLPFQQIDHGERTTKGLGIGLSLVQSFVEMHGGSIIASSEGRGRGSKFTVVLPLTQPEAEIRPPTYSTLLALVADEDDASAGSAGRLLELQGCSVIYAYDDKQIIEKTLNRSPQIVLINIYMPHRSAAELAKTLRERGYSGTLVALTAYRSDGLAVINNEYGFNDFIVKPVGLQEVRRILSEI